MAFLCCFHWGTQQRFNHVEIEHKINAFLTSHTPRSTEIGSPNKLFKLALYTVIARTLSSPVMWLPSHALSTGSESLNASNTSSSHLPTKLSQLSNLKTFITSSLFNVLAVGPTRSSSVVTLARPPTSSSLKITDRSFRYVSGINFLYLIVNLILVPVPPFLTRLFLHSSLFPLLFHHSAHP